MKLELKKFLEKFSRILILLANLVQGLWWFFVGLSRGESINYTLLILQSASLMMRLVQYFLMEKSYGLNLGLHIVSLLFYVGYFESMFLSEIENSFSILSNSLIITIAYWDYLKIAVQKYSFICKLGLPCYLLIKNIIQIISLPSLQAIESIIIIFVIVIHQIIAYYCQFNFKQNNQKTEQQLPKKCENPASPNAENLLMHSQDKSQPRNSFIQTPKQCFTTLLKDLPNEEKLKQYSNLTSFSKSQKFYKSLSSSDHSKLQLYQNLINLFPYGILILNQAQQVSYINNKCEKILECQGAQLVLEKVKTCVRNAKIPDDESESTNKQEKNQLHYRTLSQIIKTLTDKEIPIDILDIILSPSKYLALLDQNDMQKSKHPSFHQKIFIYEWLMKSESRFSNNQQKKLKLILIPTSMTNQQQDYFSASSQVKSSSKSHFSFNNDVENTVLLIIIKNITNKFKCQQMKDEQIIHHSLIKSFSHELRTPLNSCSQMLNLMKIEDSNTRFQEYIDIAQCSISLLIHQINDILDYASIQSYQFSYHVSLFAIHEISEEIEHLYKLQMKQKNIEFNVKVSENLNGKVIQNDKQRIVQLLVNILNNAIKFTQEGGSISLKITEGDLFSIIFKVKDNGIGIEEQKLSQIQNSIHDTIEFGAVLKSHQGSRQQGLGLSIAAKLVQGLVESQDNQLIINSRKNQGTVVQFKAQNLLQNNLLQSHLFTLQSGKFNQSIDQFELKELKLDDSKLIKSNSSRMDIDKEYQDQSSYSYKNTSRLNDFEKQPEILLPISPEYFSDKCIGFKTSLLKQQDSAFTKRYSSYCQKCHHVLIVDDIPFNQIALKMILNNHQIEADQAFDGFQAIEKVKQKLQQHCSTYKLILMDIEMPGINGFQTSKQILDLISNKSMIIICSAYDTQENIVQGQKLGITTFLQKPVKNDDLDVILKKLFQNETDCT
ncbi:unnamed protein product (macronuclear) [Paramecium tetraurelia]|uniref:Uncharacterized protein n=1 Tax=Paramecium tetraurelia TaxID=5888 RepID=A0DI98_PARTE|nr:uncharacterized protein GSPATT00017137001 [Paramecium tetraurelia]CAK82765.1 unnamed protein product [Paramecium tetraurelia]|eukprot:XP_001450162.1 hypothetical protein (macronuclear) [Paramecium tetraurelia strain d4-2]